MLDSRDFNIASIVSQLAFSGMGIAPLAPTKAITHAVHNMKNKMLALLLLAAVSGGAVAAPLGTSFKLVAATDNGTELRRLVSFAQAPESAAVDSTRLKIWSQDGLIFDGAYFGTQAVELGDEGNLTAMIVTVETRVRPVVLTQAMSMPTVSTPMLHQGGFDRVPVATAPAPAAGNSNNVIVVSEPGLLFLTGLGLIVAGLLRRRR